ncbi:MAG: HlyD family type I secretion periplasmic adaptor subunit [Telmatospirillum sp.]|nr:HlyD family type I secretion periplasmic adaptor subunit [Telmatospirillum sp.]
MPLPAIFHKKLESATLDILHKGTALVTRLDSNLTPVDKLGDVRRPLWIGIMIILVTFGGVGLWAVTAELDSAAQAPGVVIAEGNRRIIQHLEGGIVKEILVTEGQEVKAGDVLVRLDDVRVRAQLGIVQADLDLQRAVEARLLAERDGLKEPQFPKTLLDRMQKDVTVANIVNGQRNLFFARRATMKGQHEILDQRINQNNEQIAAIRSEAEAKGKQIALINEELSDLSGLLDAGYVTKTRVLALRREAARLQGELGEHQATIARTQQAIGEDRLQILQIEKQRQEEVAKELRDVQARITEDSERQVAAEDQTRRVDITSPVDGAVLNLMIHTVGGVITPGSPIMEIVPSDEKLVVEAQVNPLDINTVHAGQDVALHVSAAGARLIPVIYGTVEGVSADRVTDQKTGHAYYKAKITVSKDQLSRLGDVKLQSGMAVEAMISRGSQSALHYAVKPLLESLTRSFREE